MKIECTKKEYEDLLHAISVFCEDMRCEYDWDLGGCLFRALDELDCELHDFDCEECARQRIEWTITDKTKE